MNISEAIQSALNNLQLGDLQKAEIMLREILSTQPDDINALHFLGVVYYQMKKYDLAIEYIGKALQLNPTYADAYNNLGLALQEAGRINEALACYQKAIDLKPEFTIAYHNLRELLKNGGYLEKAVESFDKELISTKRFMESKPDESIIKGKRLKILVTGTGRCGTGYMAKLLTSAGLPCGHEEIFSYIMNTEKMINNNNIGESSWLAVPFLSSPWFNETLKIHAVRNPLQTVQSLIGIEFFVKKDFYYLYAERFLPELRIIRPDKAPFYYFLEWTKMILQYEVNERYIRHKVEDNPVPFIKRLGGDAINLFSNMKYNTRWKNKLPEELTPNDIPEEYKSEFLEISERIGYKLTP